MASRLPDRVYTRDHFPNVDGCTDAKPRISGLFDVTIDCDVVVVGSGAGGAVVAAELAEGGLDVVVIEEGGYHSTDEFTTEAAAMVRKLYRDGGMTLAMGTPPVLFAEGKCVGGSTVVNGGMSWRTPDEVLARWHKEDDVEGILSPEMDRYFARVEKFISAAKQDDGTIGRDNALLKKGADALDWQIVENIRNQKHCAGMNNCAWGCPSGAKRSSLVSDLPRALHFGARIYADCRVEKLVRSGDVITGVHARVIEHDATQSHHVFVRAKKAVVVACGAIQTPALLSRSGIKSPSEQIGHNLALHPNTKLIAIFDEDVEGHKGAHQVFQVRQFQEEGIVMAAVNVPPSLISMSLGAYGRELQEAMADYHRMVSGGVLVEDSVFGRVRTMPGGQPMAFYQLCDRDAAKLVRGMALLSELMFAAGAKKIILPFEGVPAMTSPDDIKLLATREIPKSSIEVMTVHMMCTARMGNDPRRHVCDSFGKVYGSEALYVADASLFPSPIGVNPMETIMALATRNSARLLDRYAG